MSNIFFVEILNNNGDVQTRQQFLSLPIRIGRAYTNDIILDDPHTSAEHAVIEESESGILTIRDLDSHNGIRLNGKREKNIVIDSDAIYQLGHTQLRIRTNDYVVTSTTIDAINHQWEGLPLAFIAVSIVSLLVFGSTWLGDIEENKSTPYVISIFSWLGFAALWAGIWGLANRVFGGAAHFSRHLLTFSVALVVLYGWGYLAMLLSYGYSWTLLTRFGNHVEIMVIAVMIYFHLSQITPLKRKRLKIICVSLAVFGSGLLLMKNYQSSNQYADELYMHDILPPAVRMSRNHSLSEFNQNISQLKASIDAEKAKAQKAK